MSKYNESAKICLFLSKMFLLTPLTCYADEKSCYEEINSISGWEVASAILSIPLTILNPATPIVAYAMKISLESPEEKQKAAECLKKYDSNIKFDDTVSIVKGLLEEGKRNEVKNMEIALGASDYKNIEGSIGYKFIGASINYEKQSNNTFMMKIEYK